MNIGNDVIHLGEIKWFGGYNSKRDWYNHCGVIVGIGDFFFQASAFDSPNIKKHIQVQLKNQSAFFSFEQQDNTRIKWVKLICEMTEEELLNLYKQNDSVKKILNNPSQYLSLLKIPVVRSLFSEIKNNIGLPRILSGLQDNSNIPNDVQCFIIQNIPWNELTDDIAIEFFLTLRDDKYEKAEILMSIFPAWINDARVLDKLKVGYFPKCISAAIENNDYSLIYKLFNNVTDWNVKKVIATYLPADSYLWDPNFCKTLPEQKIIEFVQNYVNVDHIHNLEPITVLLTVIDPTIYPKSTIVLGEQFLKCNLPLSMWKQLNNVNKVWTILFLSLHLDTLPVWKESFGEIYIYEHQTTAERNNAILAVTEFLMIALVEEKKKQDTFNKGHTYLEQAIIHDFEKNGVPSAELMQLICRCKSDEFLVCAARYWKSKNTVWCNTNRASCNMFKSDDGNGIDYHKTTFVYSRTHQSDTDLCRLSVADLLDRIGYIPELNTIYNSVFKSSWGFEEYPYRISGRILQLNRLFSHMHCKCGKTLKSNYAYSVKIDARISITHAYCAEAFPGNNELHDPDVYLNECWNCDEVIDSRESQFKQTNDGKYYPVSRTDINGYYVCMRCGAGTLNIKPSICPKCGCVEQELLEFRDLTPSKKKFVKCNKCGYSSSSWRSKFEVSDELRSSDYTTKKPFSAESNGNVFSAIETDELPF